MSASLVGSEMCIRDSQYGVARKADLVGGAGPLVVSATTAEAVLAGVWRLQQRETSTTSWSFPGMQLRSSRAANALKTVA